MSDTYLKQCSPCDYCVSPGQDLGPVRTGDWGLGLGLDNIAYPFTQCFLEPPAIIPFSFGDYPVNQGDSAQLMCAVTRGDRPLSITWSLKGDIINSDPTLTTTMIGQQTSLLIISSVDYQHSGTYTCRAENPAGVRTHTAELKVNGILTARH